MVVGITGKYCAGKTTVASAIEQHGFIHVEVDHLGHRALEEQKAKVSSRFGPEVLGEDGSVDRRALGRIVFGDARALRDLESIVHPAMVAMVEDVIRRNVGKGVLVNAALLYRMKLDRLCDVVVWVDAPVPVRMYRAMRRDRIGLLEVLKRFRNQADVTPNAAQYSSADVDTMRVVNACGRRRLVRSLNRIIRTIDHARHE